MNGWEESAQAWIASMGENGDRGREFILDPHMKTRLENRGFAKALDVGCGEGRFCRLLQTYGIETIGIDPTPSLLEQAKTLDPVGQYHLAPAEKLPFDDEQFDLVVSCLTLIDIPDFGAAIKEMARVLKPKGTLLIANLNSFQTAGVGQNWQKDEHGNKTVYAIDHYLTASEHWIEWHGIKIKNHHRPLSDYMKALLANGLSLTYFDEPRPVGGDALWQEYYVRVPWFMIMEWQKP